MANYYKIEDGILKLFEGDVAPNGYTEYDTQNEPQEILDFLALQDELAQKQIRIDELNKLLAGTDYMVLPDYDKPNDEVKLQRAAWREELRNLLA